MDGYKFEILHEGVASKDQFEGATHEKVAQNLYDLISSSPEGVTIGLEGSWGSGKSTAVNLLSKKLSTSEEQTLIYLFDAWAHDGDPLRRIFLEELIERIDPKRQDTYLTRLKDEISMRTKTVSVSTTKSTSMLGGWLSLSAIAVPVGAAILSAIDYSTVSFTLTEKPSLHWLFISGLCLAIAPLFTLILWAIWGDQDKSKASKKWFWLKKKWDVFESNSTENFTQDITEDGERTSIEFEQFFKQIMEHCVGDEKPFVRALIVIDNLDRVEPNKALAIWSILQTFFQHRSSSEKSDWLTRLWFLVPHDRDGLSRVWGNQQAEDNTEQASTNQVAASFLEKSFQIIEEVPAPVMTSWSNFCRQSISTALVGWPEDDRNAVFNTFIRNKSSMSASPTPRQIQAFINRVGVLGMRWGGQVPADVIAAYAILRKDQSDKQLRSTLLTLGSPAKIGGNITETDAKGYLAGMLFGVNKNKGLQLLLGPEIKSALESGDGTVLKELIEVHQQGFWVAWYASKSKLLPDEGEETYRLSATQAFCEATSDYPEKVEEDLDALINDWQKTAPQWGFISPYYDPALKALISALDESRRAAFLGWLTTTLQSLLRKRIEQKKLADSDLGAWIDTFIKVSNLLDSPLKPVRMKDANEADWLEWLETLTAADVSTNLVLPSSEAVTALINRVDATSAGKEYLARIIRSVSIDPQNKIWSSLVVQLTTWATSSSYELGLRNAYLLLIELYVSQSEDVKENIKAALEHPHFLSRSSQETIESVPELVALLTIVFDGQVEKTKVADNVRSFWDTVSDEELFTPVLDILIKYDSLDLIWHLGVNKSSLALHLISKGFVEPTFSSKVGAEFIDEIAWESDDACNDIAIRLIGGGAFSKAKELFQKSPDPYKKCMAIFYNAGDKETREAIDSILSKLTSEQWLKCLTGDVSLLNCIVGKGNHELKDAFKLLIADEFGKGVLKSPVWGSLSILLPKLLDQHLVAEQLAIGYLNLEEDIFSDAQFDELSTFIEGALPFEKHLELNTRVDQWLSNGLWRRIQWLLTQNIKLSQDPIESLASRVQSMFLEASKEYSQPLEALAVMFNIELPEPQVEDEIKSD